MYQKEIKKNNENIIFEYIYNQKQGFSIAEVCQSLDLTFPTVKRIFESFLEKSILIQAKKNNHGVGRKAMEYTYNNDFCYSIGVRISEDFRYDFQGCKYLFSVRPGSLLQVLFLEHHRYILKHGLLLLKQLHLALIQPYDT